MDTKITKHDHQMIESNRKNEVINKRKNTSIKKAHELEEFNGVDMALIICKHGEYTVYKSSVGFQRGVAY